MKTTSRISLATANWPRLMQTIVKNDYVGLRCPICTGLPRHSSVKMTKKNGTVVYRCRQCALEQGMLCRHCGEVPALHEAKTRKCLFGPERYA